MVIGVAAYFLSQPRRGSVEYHKREYLKTVARWEEKRIVDRLKDAYYRMRNVTPDRDMNTFMANLDTMHHHAACLVRLGYLAEFQYASTNGRHAIFRIMNCGYNYRNQYLERADVMRDFTLIGEPSSNVISVIARPSDLPAIETAIRKADATMWPQ